MTEVKRIIWHWKQFDLDAPLYELCSKFGEDVEFSGLLTKDSTGSPAEQANSFLGVPRISRNRYQHYRDCISLLKTQYSTRGYELIASSETIESFLAGLEQKSQRYEIWYYPHLGNEERHFLSVLEANKADHINFKALKPNTLLTEAELPFEVKSLPDTFSAFRKKIEKRAYTSYRFSRYPHTFSRLNSEGRRRFETYVFKERKILTYKQTRNGLGPGDYSSKLSKWLAVHAIQAAEIGSAILHFEATDTKNESTYWLLFELLWRDYFHFLHKKIDTRLFMPSGSKGVRSPGLQDSMHWTFTGSNYRMSFADTDRDLLMSHWENFRKWARGQTGESFIDVMMQELFFTGEISNRARQCAASYLIHDLHLPWWWGAQWFEYLLIDYDVSSNWGNWAYIAGVGADPRPVRRFNIQRQAQKYDPNGSYRAWGMEQGWTVPEDALPISFPGSFHTQGGVPNGG